MLYTEDSPWCDLKCDFSNLQAADREQKVNSNASKCPHDRKKSAETQSLCTCRSAVLLQGLTSDL